MPIDSYKVSVEYDKDNNIPGDVLQASSKAVTATTQSDTLALEKTGRQSAFAPFMRGVEDGSIVITIEIGTKINYGQPDKDINLKNSLNVIRRMPIQLMANISKISRHDLEVARDTINESLSNVEAYNSLFNAQFNINDVADSIIAHQNAVSCLTESENLSVFTGGEKILVPKRYILSDEIRDELIVKTKTRESVNNAVLIVKKPDYLKKSMWDFLYDGRLIRAKILDDRFRVNFQKREPGYEILPRDSIVADIVILHEIGYNDETVRVHYEINHVRNIKPDETRRQTKI